MSVSMGRRETIMIASTTKTLEHCGSTDGRVANACGERTVKNRPFGASNSTASPSAVCALPCVHSIHSADWLLQAVVRLWPYSLMRGVLMPTDDSSSAGGPAPNDACSDSDEPNPMDAIARSRSARQSMSSAPCASSSGISCGTISGVVA